MAMATAGRSVDTDRDTDRVDANPRRSRQTDQELPVRSDEGRETSSPADTRPEQQTEDVVVREDCRAPSSRKAITSPTLSEDYRNTIPILHTNSNDNSTPNSTCGAKHKRKPPSRPRETKASQLRIKSHSVTDMNPSDKLNSSRPNGLKSDKPTSASSEESLERDKMESTPQSVGITKICDGESTPQTQHKGKGANRECVSPYGPATDKYLTPLQQKERLNKDLNMHIAKLEQTLLDQDDRIRQFEEEKQKALEDVGKTNDTEIGKLLIEIKNLQIRHEESKNAVSEISDLLSDERKRNASLEEQITKLHREQAERETVHQKRYLDMYQKGREAQLIDQEEDLVCTAIATAPTGDGRSRHLVKKLERTEKELEKLRQTFREDVYHKTPQLDTDSAAQVEILKSAVYYYLTDTQPAVNLNVMLSMLHYSDVQRRNIISHIKKKSK